MKKSIFIAITCGLLFASCSKKTPDEIVNEFYTLANQGKYDKAMTHVMPDSLAPFTEADLQLLQRKMYSRLPKTPLYNEISFEPVQYNSTGDTATFIVHTISNQGISYNESGKLVMDGKGNWKILLTPDSYSVSDDKNYTPELMRNLDYSLIMTLASRGLPSYQKRAANYYFDGVMTPKNYDEYFKYIKSVADSGDDEAKYKVAECLVEGWGTKTDPDKAFEMYKQLSDGGYPLAMYNTGCCYHQGIGTVKDYSEAIKYYEKAAEAGVPKALRKLGNMYWYGEGFSKDYKKASEYYQLGIEKGDITCYGNLANCYCEGKGVAKDLKKAEELYKKELGFEEDDNTLVNLGLLYYFDTKEYHKAFYCFKKAADNNYNLGQYYLGMCYEYGKGTEKNRKKAYDFYRAAAANGYGPAQDALWRVW